MTVETVRAEVARRRLVADHHRRIAERTADTLGYPIGTHDSMALRCWFEIDGGAQSFDHVEATPR
jgi:hypothetical protein